MQPEQHHGFPRRSAAAYRTATVNRSSDRSPAPLDYRRMTSDTPSTSVSTDAVVSVASCGRPTTAPENQAAPDESAACPTRQNYSPSALSRVQNSAATLG